jgi:hypothetical protein
MDRRRFLRWTARAGALFLAAHEFAAAEPMPTAVKQQPGSRPLILGLELRSAAPLLEVRDFYHGLLGLRIVTDQPERLAILAGATTLTFIPAGPNDGQPFYHFAFNVPENKIESAWRWQKARTSLLPIPTRLRDPQYPDDVVNYTHWNAHSVFFFDPAGNVVEYIARHDLKNPAPGEFNSDDILYASEIAFVTDDVLGVSDHLKGIAKIPPFRRGGDESFMALGGEDGLLLVMKRGRVISFDSPQKKAVGVFGTSATIRGSKAGTHSLEGHPFSLAIEST